MKDNFVKKLLERLSQKQTIIKRNYGENLYLENRKKLISLLLSHPYYIEGIIKLKNSIKNSKIPVGESNEKVFFWEHFNDNNVRLIRKKIQKLISEFNFNVLYINDIEQFTYDYIICPSRIEKISKENIPSLVIVNTDEDRKINAHLFSSNSRYIQIFDWTTLKDIQENWDKIKEGILEKSIEIDVSDDLSKLLWKLKLEGKNIKEMTYDVNTKYKYLLSKIKDNLLGEDNTRVYIHRYETRLKKLKDF
ncbi:MAG: hypothetical protein WC827_01735 [Candidatus Paceibacterota bacterium]|jgi:hypothetical protein